MGPTGVSQPLADDPIDLFTKNPPDEPRNDSNSNKCMDTKIQPAFFRSRFVFWLNCFGWLVQIHMNDKKSKERVVAVAKIIIIEVAVINKPESVCCTERIS